MSLDAVTIPAYVAGVRALGPVRFRLSFGETRAHYPRRTKKAIRKWMFFRPMGRAERRRVAAALRVRVP